MKVVFEVLKSKNHVYDYDGILLKWVFECGDRNGEKVKNQKVWLI